MKLIVTGSTGFVATEIIRQSLHLPKITSVIAIARRQVSPPPDLSPSADTSKLRSVVVDDYGTYSDNVKAQLAGADACIWTAAITPGKSRTLPIEEVRKVNQTDPLVGLEAMFNAHKEGGRPPFRFMYMSGVGAERDQTKKPSWMPEFCLMRGVTETRLLAFAAEKKGALEVSIAKPGLITAPGRILRSILAPILKYVRGTPVVDIREVAGSLLKEVGEGFSAETLENADLVRIGREALKGDA